MSGGKATTHSCAKSSSPQRMPSVMLKQGFPGGSAVKERLAMQEMWVRFPGWEDPLEEGMATHSKILAWRIPWTEEPGRLQSMGSQRVRQDWMQLSTHTGIHGKHLVKRPGSGRQKLSAGIPVSTPVFLPSTAFGQLMNMYGAILRCSL